MLSDKNLYLLLCLSTFTSAPPMSFAQTLEQAPADKIASRAVVDLNTATIEELENLPGIGPTRAQAIVTRRARRPFQKVEDLLTVRGIGRATFRRLRPLVAVNPPPRKPHASPEKSRASP